MSSLTREAILELDKQDPLAACRDLFQLPEGALYFDGNSLGVLPKSTVGRMAEVVTQEWGGKLIDSWMGADWINAPQRVGDKIARLIGAEAGEVVVADSTSINIFKTLIAALQINKGRKVIMSEAGNFPTDLYMMQGVQKLLPEDTAIAVVESENILSSLNEDVAVVLLTEVNYKTGYIHDMQAITQAAHAAGVLVIWDLCHSAGSIPVDLNACEADFAIGCGYKFLNGGPGAPAFLFCARRHQQQCQPVLSGWFGHKAQFAFTDDYEPAADIRRFLCGTAPVLGLAALESGVDVYLDVDMQALRRKAQKLGDVFIQLMAEADFEQYGFKLVSPKDSAIRGGHVSIAHEEGYAIMQAMKARGLTGDFRSPDVLRFGITPLYLRYVDVIDAVEIIQEIMQSGAWQKDEYKVRSVVT